LKNLGQPETSPRRSTARKAELREMLRQPGRHYSLELKRGAETISVELKTRRLL
jgi:hypothetical protein